MSEKMHSKMVLQSVVVVREGKQVRPKIGEKFDFTKEELADIERMNPAAIRDPKNESADDDAPAPVKPPKGASGEAGKGGSGEEKAAGKGGKAPKDDDDEL